MKGSLPMTKYFVTLLLVSSSLPMAASRCTDGEAYMGKKLVEVEACTWSQQPTLPPCTKKNIDLYYQQCDSTKSTAAFTKYMKDLNAYKSLVTVQGEEYKMYPMVKQFTMTMKWSFELQNSMDSGLRWTADTFAGKTKFGTRSEFTLSKYIQQGLSDAFCMLSMQMDSDSCPYDDGVKRADGRSGCSDSSSPLCAWDIHVVTQSDDDAVGGQSGNGGLHTYMPTGDAQVRTLKNYAVQSALNFDNWGYHGYSRPAMQMPEVEFVGEEVVETFEGEKLKMQPVKVTFVVFLKNAYQALAMDHLFEFIGTDTMDTFLEHYVKMYINSQLKYYTHINAGDTRLSRTENPVGGYPFIYSVDEITVLKPRSGSECPQDRKYGGGYITYDQFMYRDNKHQISPYKGNPEVMEAQVTSAGKPMEFCLDRREMDILHSGDNFMIGADAKGHSSYPMYLSYSMRIGITNYEKTFDYTSTTTVPTTTKAVTKIIQGKMSTTTEAVRGATKQDFHEVKDGKVALAYANGIADRLELPQDDVTVTLPKDLTSEEMSFDISYTITVPPNAARTADDIVQFIENYGLFDWGSLLTRSLSSYRYSQSGGATGEFMIKVTSIDKPTVTAGGRRLASANDFKFFGVDGFYRSAAVNNAFVNAILFVMHEAGKYGSDGDGKFMNGELGKMTAANVKLFLPEGIKEAEGRTVTSMDVTYVVRVTNRQERDAYFGFANWGAAVYLLNRQLVKEFADISTLPTGYTPYPKINYDPKYKNGDLVGGIAGGRVGLRTKTTLPCDSEVVAGLGFVEPCASTGGSGGGSDGGSDGGNSTGGSAESSGTTRMTGTIMAVMGVITMF